MTLRLSVVSEHAIRLGPAASKVFGVHGGSIGRGTDNEWILPDPERYLSGKHARVDFRAGAYILVDTSSNGTYVNGAQVALGKYHDYQLKHGDHIRVGEYEFLVSIDKSNDFPPDESVIIAADLDLNELLELSDQGSLETEPAARNAYGQAAGLQRDLPEDSATPWHMSTRPLKVAGAATSPATPPASSVSGVSSPGAGAALQPSRSQMPTLFDGDFDAAFASFCRGAGVDPQSIPADARGAALQLAGQLLRESVLGLMDLNHNRNEFRNRFRIAAPTDNGTDSPLDVSQGVDEAMVRLLSTVSIRAGSLEAVRHNFRELKAQHVASMTAMRAAFEEFIGRFDPKELEERFDRAGKRGVFGTPNKSKYWELYAEMFASLAQRPADGFPHLFNEAFARAYEARVRTMVPPRRSPFGADRHDPVEPASKAIGDP